MTIKALAAGLALALAGAGASFAQPADFVPLTEEAIREAAPENWPLYRRNYEGWGYSPLDQIDRDNVGQLQLVWSRTMEPGFNEIAPIVWNGVMYYANPGDVIQAVDAANGDLIWEYRRALPDTSTLNVLGERKRAIALHEDRIYFVSWDNVVVSLDARTGQVVWESDRGQGAEGISNTSGPIVANGVVIAGSTCQFAGFGCYVTGHDASNGEELWRNTFIPFHGEEGDETWANSPFESRWMTSAWGQITYDPELDLVFYGSSGIGPASETQRGMPGATMFGTNTRFAVRPRTGEIVWRHQVLPRDNWDQECTFEMLPLDTPVNPSPDAEGMLAIGPAANGETVRTLTGVPCKTGVLWSFAAATGEFLWAKQTTEQNLIAGIDQTGAVAIDESRVLTHVGEPVAWCPSHSGGRDWPSTAYNPQTRVLFIPLLNMCQQSTPRAYEPSTADVYNVDIVRSLAPGKTEVGRLDAVSVETGETLWSWETRTPLYAPVTATGGGLLFVGGMDRYFRAIDQETGETLWQTRLPGHVEGHPITYSVDGRQYVSVPAGGGTGTVALILAPEIDGVAGSNAMFTFALPER